MNTFFVSSVPPTILLHRIIYEQQEYVCIIYVSSNHLRGFTLFSSHNYPAANQHVDRGGVNALLPVARCLCVQRPHFKLEWRPLSAVCSLQAATANRRRYTENTGGKRRIHEGDRLLSCSLIISLSTDAPSVSLTMEMPTQKTPRSTDSRTESLRSCPCRRTAKKPSPR